MPVLRNNNQACISHGSVCTEPGTSRSPDRLCPCVAISCAACPVYKHEGICTECRTNITKLFVLDRTNSTEIFARDRTNSTEIFVRDRTNSHSVFNMCAIEVIVPTVIVDKVVDELRSYIATRDMCGFHSTHFNW